MKQTRHATVIAIMAAREELDTTRTDLVRLPRGADTSLFRGWGIRI